MYANTLESQSVPTEPAIGNQPSVKPNNHNHKINDTNPGIAKVI